MGACVLVAFIVPGQAGLAFPRSDWPLHIAVARFDTRETADFVSARIDGVLPARWGFGVRIGADAQFGRDPCVPVSLLDPEPAMIRRAAPVDMRPDNDPRLRRVLAAW
ncbi:hypothetical protein DQ353_12435 [Arthrobacter sp. AQ5-05]|nr:hypothetical protein DQ353_12435 [Arthrobacter sp. AQ5-05]